MRIERLEADKRYIQLMLEYAEEAQRTLVKIRQYGIDIQDEMVISSLAMHIGQIGEQLDSRKLSRETQEKYEDLLPWSQIKRFRDKAYHHYGDRNSKEITTIAVYELPSLIEKLHYILRDLAKEQEKE